MKEQTTDWDKLFAITKHIKDLYLEYINNTNNSVMIKTQLKLRVISSPIKEFSED